MGRTALPHERRGALRIASAANGNEKITTAQAHQGNKVAWAAGLGQVRGQISLGRGKNPSKPRAGGGQS
jgi:hypothetical protein